MKTIYKLKGPYGSRGAENANYAKRNRGERNIADIRKEMAQFETADFDEAVAKAQHYAGDLQSAMMDADSGDDRPYVRVDIMEDERSVNHVSVG